jgi:hypothetical protein
LGHKHFWEFKQIALVDEPLNDALALHDIFDGVVYMVLSGLFDDILDAISDDILDEILNDLLNGFRWSNAYCINYCI